MLESGVQFSGRLTTVTNSSCKNFPRFFCENKFLKLNIPDESNWRMDSVFLAHRCIGSPDHRIRHAHGLNRDGWSMTSLITAVRIVPLNHILISTSHYCLLNGTYSTLPISSNQKTITPMNFHLVWPICWVVLSELLHPKPESENWHRLIFRLRIHSIQ